MTLVVGIQPYIMRPFRHVDCNEVVFRCLLDARIQTVLFVVSNSVQYFPLVSVQFFPLFRLFEPDFYDA